MNDQSNLPAERRERTPIEALKAQVSKKADDFKMALPAHISVEKFQRTLATAAMGNPDLITRCDRQSLLMAAMKLAQDGLLPDGREAALVPFSQRYKGDDGQWYSRWLVQPMPMVYGLRKKILQSGEVVSLEVGVVYRREVEEGHFIYEVGMEPPVRHRPMLDLTDEDIHDDNIVAAYSIARLRNEAGGEPFTSAEVLRRADINKIREASQTGATKDRKGKPRVPSGPWVDWFGEMAKKSALRRHSKVLPMSGDVLDAINDDSDEEFRARGASALLDAEQDEPLRLPSDEELDGQADEADDGETVDQETGEVTTDSRGMTEVDEETARELDQQQDGANDEPEGDEDQPETGDSEDDGAEDESAMRLAGIRQAIADAKSEGALKKADGEWEKARAAYDDDTVEAVDTEIRERFKAVRSRKTGEG